jgi:hypothetical protein
MRISEPLLQKRAFPILCYVNVPITLGFLSSCERWQARDKSDSLTLAATVNESPRLYYSRGRQARLVAPVFFLSSDDSSLACIHPTAAAATKGTPIRLVLGIAGSRERERERGTRTIEKRTIAWTDTSSLNCTFHTFGREPLTHCFVVVIARSAATKQSS